jgi:hypothetical protein
MSRHSAPPGVVSYAREGGSKSILDDPTRAAFYQSNWYIVWLVGALLLMGAWRRAARKPRPPARAKPTAP